MTLRRFFCLLFCLLLWGAGPRAGLAGEGTTGADFLNILPGARSAALAGCYSGLGNDAETLFYNPAGMTGLLNPQLGFSHLAYWDGISYDAIWGVQPLGERGAAGITAAFLNVQPFNSTDDPTIPSEQAWNLMASAGYAYKPMRALALGGQVKYLMLALSTARSWGAAADLGVQYFLMNDQAVLAAEVQNLGFLNAFDQTGDPLPLKAGVGAAYHFWPDEPHRLSLDAEASFPARGQISAGVGAEAWVWNTVALRVGIKSGADAGDWLTVGAGVHWQGLHVDYALTPLGLLGMTHRISAGYDFGSQRHLSRPKLKLILLTRQFLYVDGQAGYEIKFVPSAQVAAGLSHWEVVIEDRDHRVVRQMEGNESLPMTVVWDGLNSQGDRVDIEGYYPYAFRIRDHLGYTAEVTGEILPVSITKLPQLKVIPRDIFAGKTSFSPATSDNVREWSVEVTNADGRIIKKYQGVGMIPKDFAWDGTDQNHNPVSVQDGFRFVVRTKDEAGNEVKSSAPLLVVDAGTKAHSQTSLTLPEQVPFHFKLSSETKFKAWSLDVMQSLNGKVIRSYAGSGQLPENLIWDSRDEQQRLVPNDQAYSYLVRLQDPMGNVWSQAAPIRPTEVKKLSADASGMRIKIENILFEFNKAELKPEMFDKLHKSADIVKAYPQDKVHLCIEGHTDEIGTEAYNLELSGKRAKMTMRFLVEEEGLSSLLIETRGLGKAQMIYQGTDPQMQSRNRRVEITLILPPGSY
jgi:outer membrane protein OmpA-like peptidoglycan-associated protein